MHLIGSNCRCVSSLINHAGQKTGTEKRFFHHNSELLDAHPHFFDGGRPSLHDRLEIAAAAAPELAASAAAKAIAK
jgi:hypothetical protein